jgi:hypothetical protein
MKFKPQSSRGPGAPPLTAWLDVAKDFRVQAAGGCRPGILL